MRFDSQVLTRCDWRRALLVVLVRTRNRKISVMIPMDGEKIGFWQWYQISVMASSRKETVGKVAGLIYLRILLSENMGAFSQHAILYSWFANKTPQDASPLHRSCFKQWMASAHTIDENVREIFWGDGETRGSWHLPPIPAYQKLVEPMTRTRTLSNCSGHTVCT